MRGGRSRPHTSPLSLWAGTPRRAGLPRARQHPRAHPTGELTTVEERIAALVGLGQTNREVAPTVFLSVLTVESHLGRIYRRLDLRSRTELSRLVEAISRSESDS